MKAIDEKERKENTFFMFLDLLQKNTSLIYLVAKISIGLILIGILLAPNFLKDLLGNLFAVVFIIFFNMSLAILLFIELIGQKQKSIFVLIENYLFLTISIILCFGLFYYIDEKIIEKEGSLYKVWEKNKDLERDVFYFSGVTYFTIGYGDIIPTKPYSQIAAIIEAIIGSMVNLIAIGIAIKELK
ncbi:MAG: ion channel [Candidatus Anstonellaceae archaeon]